MRIFIIKKSDQPLHTYRENRIFGSLNGFLINDDYEKKHT